ncbi:hypothetical protein SLA2020_284500 [Shorea laevis]
MSWKGVENLWECDVSGEGEGWNNSEAEEWIGTCLLRWIEVFRRSWCAVVCGGFEISEEALVQVPELGPMGTVKVPLVCQSSLDYGMGKTCLVGKNDMLVGDNSACLFGDNDVEAANFLGKGR